MSEQRFHALPPEVQELLSDAGRQSALLERRLYAESDNSLLPVLESKGVEVTYPDPAPFRAASRSVYDEFVTSETDRALLDAILQ
jgi:TRAP-type C4-dicarboxylate transport system substrate-binding protein